MELFLFGVLVFSIGFGFYMTSLPITIMTFGGLLMAAALVHGLLKYLNTGA